MIMIMIMIMIIWIDVESLFPNNGKEGKIWGRSLTSAERRDMRT